MQLFSNCVRVKAETHRPLSYILFAVKVMCSIPKSKVSLWCQTAVHMNQILMALAGVQTFAKTQTGLLK